MLHFDTALFYALQSAGHAEVPQVHNRPCLVYRALYTHMPALWCTLHQHRVTDYGSPDKEEYFDCIYK